VVFGEFMPSFDLTRLILPGIIFTVCGCLLILSMVLRKKVVKKHGLSEVLARKARAPIQIFVILTALYVVFEILQYRWILYPIIERIYSTLAALCYGWLAIKIIDLISSLLLTYFDIQQADNLLARKVHTQVRVLKRLSIAFVVIFVAVGILITFDSVRAQGTSLLASAGVLSIIVGLAAQKTMGNLFGGIQIAIAKPILVDDVVVVENEWGRIEEIHLTFVVVKLWDLRRLIVPISYFTDRSFQNWTKKTADLLGTVMLYVDYTMPVTYIREELNKWIKGNNLWDGKVNVVQVTNTTEQTMEIRILISASNSGAVFDLRCAIREHMIDFIQKNYPHSLPRVRSERVEELKEDLPNTPTPPKDPVRAPAPTLDAHPKPMDTKK